MEAIPNPKSKPPPDIIVVLEKAIPNPKSDTFIEMSQCSMLTDGLVLFWSHILVGCQAKTHRRVEIARQICLASARI